MSKEHKLLIVDDQWGIRILLTEIFSGEYTVETAGSGTEALEKLRALNPSLILLDMKMPGLSGPETLRLIREINHSVPVVMMSGLDETEVIDQTRELAPVYYINKPFDLNDIKRMVEELLVEAERSGTVCSV
ncbi:two-component system response regulator (stage 0 sporulation protein F) [Desulfohalotomaculum tongense]|uniref:response regulator n=1 Tax=Desulforadius tongensis TaxID=1216062 RepID=UPI001EE5C93C|nr:response regulator [Desulforadius tongensis]MBM7853758.1 two-component system response regulator (stage 0 sporulation protein F) [Desulforadius tongensis]